MNNQSWLSRLWRRKPDQQRTTQATQSSPSVLFPQSTDKGDQTSAMSVSEQRAAQEYHVPPLGTPAVPKDAQGAVWHIGEELLNQYEVMGILGEGGMGMVYKVHHRGWNIDLAVKNPQPALFAREGGKENFIREAETWVNLPLHPHIVSCYYVRLIDEIPRIFAEYVAGGSLGDWIRSRRLYEGGQQQALERMLDLAIQFAWGLHAAHEQGLVHQDIKPANVMMTPDGVVKVTDFGLAKARAMAGEQGSEEDNDRRSILVSSRGMTPAYCSPEQAAGKALSRKTDIWSWGVSLLEMWVGEVTWRSGILAREVLSSYEPQDAAIPPLPAGLVKLLARCFALRPEDRPMTMLEVATALQEIYAREIGQAYLREAPQTAKLQADSLNNRALSLYDLGKVTEAVQVWNQALQTDPLHLEATYNRGVVLWRQGDVTDKKLVAALEAIRAIQGQHWRISSALAQIHLERGDLDQALLLLEEAAQKAPDEKEITELLKRIQVATKDSIRNSRTFQGVNGSAYPVSLSADGHWALSAGDETEPIRLWDTTTGRCQHTFQGHGTYVNAVSLSADGRLALSGGNDKTVRLWDTASGRCLHIFEGHTQLVTTVSLSADGRLALSGSNDLTVRLWDTISGRCLRVLQGDRWTVKAVSLSADGRLALSGGDDKTARLWDTASGRCLRIFEGHTKEVTAVSLSADGRLALLGDSVKTLSLWETATGRCLRTFQGLEAFVSSASLSFDGRWVVSSTGDYTVRLWEVGTGRCLRTFQVARSRTPTLLRISVSLSADGRWIMAALMGQPAQLWEIRHDQRLACSLLLAQVFSYANVVQLKTHAETLLEQAKQALSARRFAEALELLHAVRALPGWERIDRSLAAWEALSGCCSRISLRGSWPVRTYQGFTTIVMSVSLSSDRTMFLSGELNNAVRLWDIDTGRCVREFKDGHTRGVNVVNLSPDGRWALSGGGDCLLHLWEVDTGRCLHTYQGHTRGKEMSTQLCDSNGGWAFLDGVRVVSLSTDGRWVLSGGNDGTVRLWEVASERCLRIFEGHTKGVRALSLSADGCLALSGSDDKTMRLWEIATGHCIQIFQHQSSVNAVSLSADGRQALSGTAGGSIQFWEMATGRCSFCIFQGHAAPVNAVSLSADGRWALSGSGDQTVRLWEMATGRCLHTFQGHTAPVNAVSLSADGRWALSGSGDQTVRLWELDWELEAHNSTDWDESARLYLEIFLTQHTPYAAELPQERELTEQEIKQALTRQGTPIWDEEDFQRLMRQLQYVGYGWLRPEGVRKQLASMVGERQSPSHSLNKE